MSGKIIICMSILAIQLASCNIITNFTTFNPMVVPYGNYTTFRIHGFGKGGDQRLTVNDEDDNVS